jgi:hypothetical protein
MLFIDNERIKLEDIRTYKGKDSVINHLKENLEELETRFFDRAGFIRFRWKKSLVKVNTRSGLKEGPKFISIRMAESVRTDGGDVMVTYAETSKMVGMEVKYKPSYLGFRKTLILGKNKKELALYLYAVSGIIKAASKVVIDDPEKENEVLAKKRAENSALEYYIYNEDSPLSQDEDRLRSMALSWAVADSDTIALPTLKNKLYEAVSGAKEIEYQQKAFIEAVKEESPFYDILALINKVESMKILKYSDFEWNLTSPTGERRMMLKVPPQNSGRAKFQLAYELLGNSNKYQSLKAAYDPDYVFKKGEELKIRVSEDELERMKWIDILKLGKSLRIPVQKRDPMVEAIRKKLKEQ